MNAKTSASAGNTWRDLPAAQQPEYPDTEALRAVIADLESYPPLVFAGECDQLRARLAAVAKGEAFLLQGATAPRPSTPCPRTTSATSSRPCSRWAPC